MTEDSNECFTDHRQAWEHLYGPNGKEEECERKFATMFPKGHATSIRDFAKDAQTWVEEGKAFEGTGLSELADFHPRAFALLVEYGIDYVPLDWRTRDAHTSELQPEPGQCFVNAWRLMEVSNRSPSASKGLVYVEGVVIGLHVHPMHHAWNSYSLTSTVAHDWSHYPSAHWSRYLGIPLTEQEYNDLCARVHPDTPTLKCALLGKEDFPAAEELLTEILRARKTIPAVTT